MAPHDPESSLTVARAALDARDLSAARAAIAHLIASDSPTGRPTRRVCLLMADIEETEGNHGAVREWLGRAARAPRDKAWVADGVISDRWAPVSPSGTLDGFVWRTPEERLAVSVESAVVPPPAQAIAQAIAAPAPAAPIAPPQEVVEPEPSLAPAPAHAVVPAPRTGVIVDPTSMSPDDPGPQEQEGKRRGGWLYASE
jgi:HemY protein